MSVPTPKIIGYGSFGAVLEPALENVDESGTPISFPGMVSKVMMSKHEFNEAKQASNAIHTAVPSLSLNFIPYRKNYSVKNLPANVQGPLKTMMQRKGLPGSNIDPVYVARMQNLGHSFADIVRNPALYRELRNRSVPTFCREILKLLRIVKNIKDAGYIHGDIRQTNVLCNVYTGTMTIIDFDWFKKADTFLREYPVYFFCHPPELIYLYRNRFHKNKFSLYDPTMFKNASKQLIQYELGKYDANYDWVGSDPVDVYTKETFYADVNDASQQLWDDIYTRHKYPSWEDGVKAMEKKYKETADLYGLGVALFFALYNVLIRPDQAKLREYLFKNFFPKILHANFYKRISVEDAIESMETFIRMHVPEMELGEIPNAKDELARLSTYMNFITEKNSPVPDAVEALERITHATFGGKRTRKRTRKYRQKKRKL